MSRTLFELYQARVQAGVLQADPHQAAAIAALDHLANELEHVADKGLFSFIKRRHKITRGVYMYGGVGRGKSMVMDLFFESLPNNVAKRRVHFHEFMFGIHDGLHERRGDGVEAILPDLAREIAQSTRLLCFDEFHVTDVADAMILGRLFTLLFLEGVVVVATSNWPPDRLYEGGLQRDLFLPFIGLLKEHMSVIALDGETDYRMKGVSEEGTYFWPLSRLSRKKADGLFSALTEGATPYNETLSVKGRPIKVKAAAGGVARFSFAQLCEQPRGAEDYLMIARNYHTVVLEEVPRLDFDRRNEAKRLMTLVDALYDEGTNLIVTADGPPEELYRGHDHGFEFQRTVSRLNEMQRLNYMNRKTGE